MYQAQSGEVIMTREFGKNPHADLGGGYPGMPEHIREILRELMSGATDVTASRNLNISPRTFSRRVAELMDYLGVRTRFQCGMAAARLDRTDWTDQRTGNALAPQQERRRDPWPRR